MDATALAKENRTTVLVWAGLIVFLALAQSYSSPDRGMTSMGLAQASGRFFGNVFILWSIYAVWASDYFRVPPLSPDRPKASDLWVGVGYRLLFCFAGSLLAWANAVRVQSLVYG